MIPLTLLTLLAAADPASVPADFVLKGGTVYDGTGNPAASATWPSRATASSPSARSRSPASRKVIDCNGLVVAPGFIDLHTHCDTALIQAAATRQQQNYLTAGRDHRRHRQLRLRARPTWPTTSRRLEDNGVGTNVIHSVPHNAVRQQVMGNANRPPTADELEKMEDSSTRACEDGAWGMSTGLIYNPGTYAKTDELIALAKVAAAHGGIYASHIRDEEARLARRHRGGHDDRPRGRLPVHISHIKAFGQARLGQVRRRDRADREGPGQAGQIVTADQYPYIASSTSLRATVVPTQYREGSTRDFLARLDDPELGPKIRAAIRANSASRDGGKALRIARVASHPTYAGKDLAASPSTRRNRSGHRPGDRKGRRSADRQLRHERGGRAHLHETAVGGHGQRRFVEDTGPRRRAPPAELRHLPAQDRPLCDRGESAAAGAAIRSASGLPADILQLPERGYLKTGYYADVVVFDPETFRDVATFDRPHQYSTGVKWLFVNGTAAIADGKPTQALAGRPLRHESMK